jgi:hypothetical protein
MALPEEPLLESAPLAWKLAPELCGKDPESDGSCAWYHGMWQYLRIMGLASSARDRGEFYLQAVREFAGGRPAPAILIAGTADYAMLAIVLEALGGRPASITVVDVCETPLELSRWYAARTGVAIRTVRANLLDHAPAAAYDLICTDSVLSRFPATRWPALAANWHGSLRPGGMLVTATRLRAGAPPERIGFPPDQAEAFEKAVLRIATERRGQLGVDPAVLARAAALYARRQYNYPVQSQEQVGKLLGDAGFVFDRLAITPSTAVNREGIEAPSVPAHAVGLRVIARRPPR